QLPRRFLANRREPRRRRFELRRQLGLLFAQGGYALAGVLDGGNLLPRLVEESDHLFERRAVLSLQLIQRGQTFFDLLEPDWIGFQLVEVIAQGIGSLLDRDRRRLQRLAYGRDGRIDAGDFVQLLRRRADQRQRRFGRVIESRERRCGILLDPAHVHEQA